MKQARSLGSGRQTLNETKENSSSLGESLGDDGVEKLSEEVEPFSLLNFAITISIEASEELLDLGFLLFGGGAIGETGSFTSELLDLISINFTVSVDIELVEGFFGSGEGGLSSLGNLSLVVGAKVLHL